MRVYVMIGRLATYRFDPWRGLQIMLLRCNQCQNSFFVDDQVYAAQGGAWCEQCHIPLVPVSENVAGGQPWTQPPQAQWGQAPQNQWQQNDAQWGQAPPQAQWGQQPPSDANWQQMADHPKETVALCDPVAPLPLKQDECTVAIEAWNGDDEPSQPSQPAPSWPPQQNFQKNEDIPTTDAGIIDKTQPPNAVVIGRQMAPGANEGMTRQIDVRTVQKLYGDKINPFLAFFQAIPKRFLFILGGILALAFIASAVIAYAVTRPPKIEKVISNRGELVDADAPESEKTFDDYAREAKNLSPAFIPFDGEIAHDGSIVAAAENIGIRFDGTQIADISDALSGGAFVQKIAAPAKSNAENISKPIIFLFADTLPMSAVYRIMYSMAPSTRKLLFGGTAYSGITTFNIQPCDWPDHDTFIFPSCDKVPIEVKITRTTLTMRRVIDKDAIPLYMDQNGEKISEIKTDIVGSKVQYDPLNVAISKLSMTQGASVKLAPDGDVSFGVFMDVARHIYGSNDKQNVKNIFVSTIPLM